MTMTQDTNHSDETEEFDLDIGVIYTHERDYMTPLLTSLARSGDGLRMRLILIDNASDEGVAEWKNVFKHARILRNERRLGYAANLNRILKASTAQYVLLLNTDMTFDPDEQCLAKMTAFFDREARCGLAGCRLYHPNGTYGYPARRFPRLTTIVARRFSRIVRAPRTLHNYLYEDRDREATFECDWLSGCFLMLRRACHQQVGRFDEGFRKYFEDVDYSGRVARANWRVMFFGGTYAYHWEQRASARVLSRDSWIHIASYARWIGKRLLRRYGRRPLVTDLGDCVTSDVAKIDDRRRGPMPGPHKPPVEPIKSAANQRQN